jgi:hypothetical protein
VSSLILTPETQRPEQASLPLEVIGAFLNGRIQNTGSKEMRQVKLYVPNALYACVQRERGSSKCQPFGGIIPIGELSSLESVAVQVWLPFRPHVTAYNDIKLVHSEGRGKIDFETVEVPPGFVRGHLLLLLLVTGLILYSLHVHFAERYCAQRLAAMEKREEKSPRG